MPSFRFCKFCGELHDVANWPDNHREWEPDNRSELAAPMVIRDEMDPLQGQHNGQIFTSKRAMRQSYREHGVVEVGNDPSVLNPKPRKPIRPDRTKIREAVSRAVSLGNLTRRRKDHMPTR